MLGLRRLNLDAIWLEHFPASGSGVEDRGKIEEFQRRMQEYGFSDQNCLLFNSSAKDQHDLAEIECFGLSETELQQRVSGPNILLNLSHSIHPRFLLDFERRIFCDLDPSEIFYWMTTWRWANRAITSFGPFRNRSSRRRGACSAGRLASLVEAFPGLRGASL